MGQEQSSHRRGGSTAASAAADHYAHMAPAPDDGRVSLWEGVPPPILWLAQSQLKQLLSNHTSALLHRPEQLGAIDSEGEDDDDDDIVLDDTLSSRAETRRGPLQPHEAALAAVALRDKVIGPRLQKALDRLVPARMPEATFWDNFFSHVDVIKVRLVTDYLTAQDGVGAATAAKHARWVQLFDALEPEMRQDVRRAAERIAARQQLPPLSDLEHQLGLDEHRAQRWVPDSSDASLEYVEDGPHEVAKVLKAALVSRGELADESSRSSPTRMAPGELPMWRSPDDVGRHKLELTRRPSHEGDCSVDVSDASTEITRDATEETDADEAFHETGGSKRSRLARLAKGAMNGAARSGRRGSKEVGSPSAGAPSAAEVRGEMPGAQRW